MDDAGIDVQILSYAPPSAERLEPSLARLSQLGMRAGGKGRGIKGWAVEGLHYMAGCGC